MKFWLSKLYPPFYLNQREKKGLGKYCILPTFSGLFSREAFNVAVFLGENCPGFCECVIITQI